MSCCITSCLVIIPISFACPLITSCVFSPHVSLFVLSVCLFLHLRSCTFEGRTKKKKKKQEPTKDLKLKRYILWFLGSCVFLQTVFFVISSSLKIIFSSPLVWLLYLSGSYYVTTIFKTKQNKQPLPVTCQTLFSLCSLDNKLFYLVS